MNQEKIRNSITNVLMNHNAVRDRNHDTALIEKLTNEIVLTFLNDNSNSKEQIDINMLDMRFGAFPTDGGYIIPMAPNSELEVNVTYEFKVISNEEKWDELGKTKNKGV